MSASMDARSEPELQPPAADPQAADPGAAAPSKLMIWVAAVRPKTLTASLAPVGVGVALAAADGRFDPVLGLATLLGALLIQIGTNFYNDYADFVKGADTEDRIGPARATAKGWVSPGQTLGASIGAFTGALIVGMGLVAVGGLPILAIGLSGVICGFAYTGGPYPLAYVGLGDLFVLIYFGIAAVCGTYYLQTGGLTPTAIVASVMVGLHATAILVVNNLRDRETDAVAGKRTLVVRLGPGAARAQFALCLLLPFAWPPVAWLRGELDASALLVELALLPGLVVLRQVFTRDGAELNPLLGRTALIGLLWAALFSAGVLL